MYIAMYGAMYGAVVVGVPAVISDFYTMRQKVTVTCFHGQIFQVIFGVSFYTQDYLKCIESNSWL